MDRVVVGITGASGIPYGIRLLEVLKEFDVEVHLTCSPSAELVNKHEGDGRSWKSVLALADVVHDNDNLAASVASGSFKAKAMAIVPCSGTTLGKLAAGISDNLVTRAELVMLKERRQLILVPRETPLSVSRLGPPTDTFHGSFRHQRQSLPWVTCCLSGRIIV